MSNGESGRNAVSNGESAAGAGLDRDWVFAAVAPLAERFQAEGFALYLVGGVVRDLAVAQLRGVAPPAFDIDLTTDARPDDIKRLVKPIADEVWSQGERFGTIGAHIDGQPIEVTTHRAEAYDSASRKPIVTFGDRLDEDLSRRDFTINAAAIEVPSGQLHDPFGGLADLDAKVLRTPLSPETSFTDDPLRMLRAARFIPRFLLEPDPELVEAAARLADRLRIVSVERIADELHRLLAVNNPPDAGWRFLVDTGLFRHALPGFATPELTVSAAGSASSSSPDRVELATALASMNHPDDRRRSVLVRRAGLLWPLGPEGADRELDRLRASRADRNRTRAVIEGVATVRDHAGPVDPFLVRRLAASHGVGVLDSIVALAANIGDVWPAALRPERVDDLRAVVAEVAEQEDLAHLSSPLSGQEVMAVLGIEPGPLVGQAANHLRQVRLEVGPMSVEQAKRSLLRWWADRS